MPGTLIHSPADVIRQMLINLGEGFAPADLVDWAVFYSLEPEERDKVITVFDTAGVLHGRTHVNGETQEHNGVQIRVRSPDYGSGFTKARSIAVTLDTSTALVTVVIASTSYTVYAVTRVSDVLSLGTEGASSKRSLFTINALVALTQV